MNAIKSIIRTPKNRLIKLKIPDEIPVNQDIEVIFNFNLHEESKISKIELMKQSQFDDIFKRDLDELSNDFEVIDNEAWN